MGKTNKDKKVPGYVKKDTNGLFNGGFKSEVFASKEEKEERKRKSTQDWLEELEEDEDGFDY